MNDPIAAWHAEHVNFARLLDLLEGQIAVFHAGERPNYELMLDITSYLRHYPDRIHHPREDVAFARLVERDAGLRAQINRLAQEHRVLATAGGELLERLNEAIDEQVVTREAVEAAAATYLVYYRAHLAAEEKEILPRAAQLLTREDWAAVAAATPAGRDPLFGDESEERYRELRRRIALEARAG
ncbi:MAG TPA: hemerythrin domain-containing protein [Burkholderiales bacterium]|nr:hemerythrin domain-containing protein [Burkholderiales bacterium]